MKIWVVEDDDDFLAALRWRLRRTAPTAEVIQLTTPEEALTRIVAGEAPDVLISDLMFRGVASGEDVVLAARSRGIPTLLCSDLYEPFGPAGMLRKVWFLEAPWRYICDLTAPIPEVAPCV
jgi:DNA-binding response OmpR family regulator